MPESTNQNVSTSSNNASTGISVVKAVLIGHLFVNVPVVIIMFGFLISGLLFIPRFWWVLFLTGFVIAWIWWSLTVSKWWRWALQQGAPPKRLQKLAIATGLLWSKGSIFNKTDAYNDEN